MAFRRRKTGLKRRIHWLRDSSAWSQVTFSPATAPNVATNTFRHNLLQGETNASPPAGYNLAYNQGRFTDFGDMIVDAISGKFAFGINGVPVGETAAGGQWGIYLRFGIIAVPKTTGSTYGDLSELDDATSGALYSLDPASANSNVLSGSQHPPGFAWWWRRDFAWPVVQWNAGTAFNYPSLDGEGTCPPGPYIYIKPKKRLRATDGLWFCAQMTTINLSGAVGKIQLGFTESLRIAAHRDRRRE